MLDDCYYCGSHLSNIYKTKSGKEIRYNGIDRKNNLDGYIKENVVSCCSKCNKAKMELSEKEFIELAKKIASKFPYSIV